MLNAFQAHISEKELFAEDHRVLLAISGGIDSVVMADLFHASSVHFALAHCNFKLRGTASDSDERFVRELSRELGVPFFSQHFDTDTHAKRMGASIQMAARHLRYDWLEEVRSKEGFDVIATAHHLDDVIETAIYNWTKGCGIRGLRGIPVKNGKIIRPLLFATKEEILAYSHQRKLRHREDDSNHEDKYARNKIRHHIIPVLEKLNPGLQTTMAANFQRLKESEFWFSYGLEEIKKKVWREEGASISINLALLKQYPYPLTPLYEWLSPYGFNASQLSQLIDNEKSGTGCLLFAKHHKLLKDRSVAYLEAVEGDALDSITHHIIPKGTRKILIGDHQLIIQEKTGNIVEFPSDNFSAFLDAQKITYPMRLRHWKPGDIFAPLGLKGKHQKLQDFFSNQKVNRFEKERIWILETAAGEICWIVGYRISEYFRITERTKKYLELVWI